jgi:hypothetical protein
MGKYRRGLRKELIGISQQSDEQIRFFTDTWIV